MNSAIATPAKNGRNCSRMGFHPRRKARMTRSDAPNVRTALCLKHQAKKKETEEPTKIRLDPPARNLRKHRRPRAAKHTAPRSGLTDNTNQPTGLVPNQNNRDAELAHSNAFLSRKRPRVEVIFRLSAAPSNANAADVNRHTSKNSDPSKLAKAGGIAYAR